MAEVPKTQMLDASALLPGRVILQIVNPDGRKMKHIIRQAQTTLGRSPQCEVPLDDPMISGKHCTIESDQGGWRLRDLGSSNGTMLNGEFVEDEWLQDGDRITLGKTVLNVRVEEGDGDLAAPARSAPAEEGESKTGLVVAIVIAILVLVGGGILAFVLIGGGEKKIWEAYATQAKTIVASSPCDVISSQVTAITSLGNVPSNQAKFRRSYFAKDKILLTPADKVANSRLAANDADRVRIFNEGVNYLTAQRTQMDQRLNELKVVGAKIESAERRKAVEAVESALLIYTGQADTLMRAWKNASSEAQAYSTLFDEMFVKGNPMPLTSFQNFRMTKSADAILRECQAGVQRAAATVQQALGGGA